MKVGDARFTKRLWRDERSASRAAFQRAAREKARLVLRRRVLSALERFGDLL